MAVKIREIYTDRSGKQHVSKEKIIDNVLLSHYLRDKRLLQVKHRSDAVEVVDDNDNIHYLYDPVSLIIEIISKE